MPLNVTNGPFISYSFFHSITPTQRNLVEGVDLLSIQAEAKCLGVGGCLLGILGSWDG